MTLRFATSALLRHARATALAVVALSLGTLSAGMPAPAIGAEAATLSPSEWREDLKFAMQKIR